MEVTNNQIKEFLNEWGQSDEEIKNNLEEIYDYEIEVDAEFIINTKNYRWCENYNVWITDNSESQKNIVYNHLF